MTGSRRRSKQGYRLRLFTVMAIFALCGAALVGRAVQLQVLESDFLRGQGEARHLRTLPIQAHRGRILDRNGKPLAVSAPVDSAWANPQEALKDRKGLAAVARALDLAPSEVRERLQGRREREFVYLKRHIKPAPAGRLEAIDAPGIHLQREYRRYYPMGEVAGHVLGFTNIDDRGQAGLELAYEDWLSGTNGLKRVLQDRLGHAIENLERVRAPEPGHDLRLSLDRRLQYLAYRELKAAVQARGAKSGSIVMLDPDTGHVLAMANQPAFNPNERADLTSSSARNRAVTDVFEPGSTTKPFTLAAALETGRYTPDTVIDTGPGWFVVGGHTIKDHRNYGTIDLTTLIRKSSNVGASKLALSLSPEQLWSMYTRVGFGSVTDSSFPGEASGHIEDFQGWGRLERATLSYGYGLNVTALQLAQAYAVIANDGAVHPATFVDRSSRSGRQVIEPHVARQVRQILETVVSPSGTARRARVEGYRVAGKTGTVHQSTVGGYAEDRYNAVFAGMAPASDPAVVTVVVINEPQGDEYFGGQVAAPVFARVMSGALRVLNVPPDDLPTLQADSGPVRGGKT